MADIEKAGTESPDYSALEKSLDDIVKPKAIVQKKILISDSSKTMAKFYQALFGDMVSIRATLTNNGLDTLKRLLVNEYNLLLTACEQDALNGVALSKALRASDSKNKHIPIILVCKSPCHEHVDMDNVLMIDRDNDLSKNILTHITTLLQLDNPA